MITTVISKKNITRIILLACIIIFGILWVPETQSAQIGQYFLIGNIILLFVLMELLPLWFSYKYRTILILLKIFADSYDEPLQYSYTPVTVIRKNINNTTQPTYLIKIKYLSDRTLFTLYHEWKLLDFRADLITKEKIFDLISVIIYYLQKDIPYEILHQHSKRLSHIL